MAHDFIPRRDIDFLNWSLVFRNKIVAAPSQVGLTAAQASEYSNLHDAFAAAYKTATNPSTATRPSIKVKNGARRSVERFARLLARLIQATSTVTDAQRINLGLTVRRAQPSPVPRPAERPRISAKLRFGSIVRVRVRPLNSPRRGKPRGIAGALVMSYVGEQPPSDPSKWRLTPTTKMMFDMTFRDVLPRAKVWLAAYWFNPRAQRGPACEPICTYLQCQTMLLGESQLRLAA